MPRYSKRKGIKSRKMRRAKTRRQGQSQGQGQNGGKRTIGRSMQRGIAGGGLVFGL